MRYWCSLLAVSGALAQTPAFEVASVKLSTAAGTQSNIQRDPGGGITLTNVNLRTLVMMAYKIQPFQLEGGPPWLRSKRFDVIAKAPAGASKSDTWVMLQNLLADRFHLAVRRESRELPIFELVVARGGPKFQPVHRAPGPADDFIQTNPGKMKASMAGMAGLAMTLSSTLGHQVIDRTNLNGRYDFLLEFAPEDATDSDRPSIYAALQQQLGLKLEPSRGQVQIITIERADLPAAN